MTQLLNSKKVREILSCSYQALIRLAARGLLPRRYYPNLGWRWKKEDVDRFVKEKAI